MNTITARLNQVRQRINVAEKRYNRPLGSVSLLAISKTKPTSAVLTAFNAGQRLFGESYLQDALPKIRALANYDIEWHFTGPIQSNKTRAIATHFSWVHSVDRIKIAQRLNDQRPTELKPLNICLQINMSHEKSKSGIHPEELFPMVEALSLMPNIRLRGLMAIPEATKNRENQRKSFRQLKSLQQTLIKNGYLLDTLSMGMSGNFEAAIAEGATIVRIGTALFGRRD
ncbi:MAG: YggS family pyridoxal phosphate-dependent enzyme [Gammaproteobacteria bacterium]|nr:YggS family pyridoxal phosphate-dependent enzyme [Gammaproteobacteria bacterium]